MMGPDLAGDPDLAGIIPRSILHVRPASIRIALTVALAVNRQGVLALWLYVAKDCWIEVWSQQSLPCL